MEAVENERTDVWHLIGSRSCGVDPDGAAFGPVLEGSWAVIRDEVDRSTSTRCQRCRWPPG